MRDQRDADILQGLVSASFEGRDKDQVGVHAHDHLVVEIPFYADLGGLSAPEAFVHLFVEQMPGTGHPYDLVQFAQLDEIGQLQRGHADNTSDRRFDHGMRFGDAGGFRPSSDKRIMESRAFLILRVPDIQQDISVPIGQFETTGILRHNTDIGQRTLFRRLRLVGLLIVPGRTRGYDTQRHKQATPCQAFFHIQ